MKTKQFRSLVFGLLITGSSIVLFQNCGPARVNGEYGGTSVASEVGPEGRPQATPVSLTSPEIELAVPAEISMSVSAAFNLTISFNAIPLNRNCAVTVQFVDDVGIVRGDMTQNYTPAPSTLSWNGLVQNTLTVSVPASLDAGKYNIRVFLSDWNGKVPLTPGPGVILDGNNRYIVGSFTRL